MRPFALIAAAAAVAACGPTEAPAPSSGGDVATQAPSAPSPVEFVEAFYGEDEEVPTADERRRYLAADVAAALEAGGGWHDFRTRTVAGEQRAREGRRFTLVDDAADAPTVQVSSGGSHAVVVTLCRTEAGEWRIAEAEELGHWTLRGALEMDGPVSCG